MKVTKHEVEPKFKPVVLTIEFTTQEELTAFSQLMFHDMSVPAYLFNINSIDADISKNISKIMGKIMEVL